ncbi:MAG: NAD+ synthase [Fidelibacterota bacterium]
MKIAICQINTTVGDFENNCLKILDYYQRAIKQGVDLVVFPEMAVTGYPPQDLLTKRSFIRKNDEMVAKLVANSEEPYLIFGYVRTNDRALHNSAMIAQLGKTIAFYDKILLPTYDVFDEHRYFRPGTSLAPVELKFQDRKVNVGIQICEDLWDRDYDQKVTDECVAFGADIIINISASPFNVGKRFEREQLILKKVRDLGVPFIYCNLVGAQDELVFDGHSLIYNDSGSLIGEGPQFEESMVIFDPFHSTTIKPSDYDREGELFGGLILGIRDYFLKTSHQKCVIGLSGGIDSALTACLAVEALGRENVTCLYMPSPYSSEHSKIDAEQLTSNLDVKLITLSIDKLMKDYETALSKFFSGRDHDITEENIQARIRGNILMAFSNKYGYLVLSTGNKTELALGYCTLYGDMSGGLAVISDLNKSDVYAVSHWYNSKCGETIIPESIMLKVPSAELAPGQIDPFDYEKISPLVDAIVETKASRRELIEQGYDAKLVDEMTFLIQRAEFKRRQAAPGIRVTRKAFGIGRRIPIVNHFRED